MTLLNSIVCVMSSAKAVPLHVETPVLASDVLSDASGVGTVWLKMDALQPSGSFKIRGMGHLCQEAARGGATSFVTSSGGNAGLAAAYAARALALPITVVLTNATKQSVVDTVARMGATAVRHGEVWKDADVHARSIAAATGAHYVHPFDDADAWKGHSSVVHELYRQLPQKPDAIVVSVGGGGYMIGVYEGLQAVGWDDVVIVAVESHGCHALHAAIEADEVVTLDKLTSVCTSLGASSVAEQAFLVTKRHNDAEAIDACGRFVDDHRVLVEPACGAALACVYGRKAPVEWDTLQHVVVLVCGGSKISLDELSKLRLDYPMKQ